jgi:hypothetical protein
MHSPQTRQSILSRGKWTIDLRTTTLVAIVWVLAILLFALLHRPPRDTKWVVAQGNIQDTRIIADHALQTKWGGQLTWKAEYRLAYSVAGREYAVWADSGVRGEDEDGVRLALRKSHPLCRVQYNPHKPESSVAVCR